jgi:glutaredoxin
MWMCMISTTNRIMKSYLLNWSVCCLPMPFKAARANRPSEADLPSGGVVMYCTPWCHDCTTAKEWLRARQIPFREVNISLNSAGAERVRKWANGDLVTPTFDIDGTIVVDFDEKSAWRKS